MKLFDRLFSEIQKELDLKADKQYREKIRDHFKMDVSNFLGVRIPLVRKIGNKYFKDIRHLDIDQVFEFCDLLLETKIYEHKVIAFQWSFKYKNNYQEKHFKIFERWLKNYVDDWSDCDDLCTHSLGYFIYTYPKFIPKVIKWAASKNRWLRRASAVSLIYSLREGKHLDSAFEVASKLLLDPDDLVQKGYGWMLKEGTRNYQQEVFEFVMEHKDRMPRTALRYAIEKLPASYKKQAMNK